ncbi:zeta toxin family protein [Corynebacterium falsenii]|uniref:AAA family ATPase n=1 Tax=Corynebacterium falsenii TaxID=108486 RepID=UPI00234DE5CD|nr:zeta toxin family protein [Corynebacterium falsenii]MDC7103063.1 zeta toxin family protein [Corynebacterium falsenii]
MVARVTCANPATILIDGRSGSGKTTLAAQLAAAMADVTGSQPQIVHMDDVYRGWWGLASAKKILSENILARTDAGFRTWDWYADAEGDWQAIDPRRDLIVEGCGALNRDALAAAEQRSGERVLTVLVHAPADVRRRRALARDPEFASHWDMWARQEDEHFADMPAAHIEVDTAGDAGTD